MSSRYRTALTTHFEEEERTWTLAVVFGLASVPWTYAFVAGLHIPLWPSFIASATYYATDDRGVSGLTRGYASNAVGIVFAAVTLIVVNGVLGGDAITLSFVVGVFMFLANLHAFVPVPSFTPGGFFGYATMFSIHVADATAFGVPGLPGKIIAAIVSMFIGAVIGVTTDTVTAIYAN